MLPVADEPAMARLAASLADACEGRECITLSGTLGAGKTTFAQYFIRRLTHTAMEVPSPTFLLVQEYDAVLKGGKKSKLFHLDLYRVKDASELEEIGLQEMLGEGVTLIEWPEIAAGLLPPSALGLEILPGEGEARTVAFSGAPEMLARSGVAA